MKNKITKIIDNYNTGIATGKNSNLNDAFQKVDDIKAIAGRTITKMAQNMEESNKLL